MDWLLDDPMYERLIQQAQAGAAEDDAEGAAYDDAPTDADLQDDETSREEGMEEDRQAGPIQRPMKKTN